MIRFVAATLCAVVLILSSGLCVANDAVREKAIQQLVNIQAETLMVVLDEGQLDAVLLRFRKANEDATDAQWRDVRADVRKMFFTLFTESSGPFTMVIQEAVQSFATEDLIKLVAFHNDPIYVKYSRAAASVMKQRKLPLSIRTAIEGSVVEINDALKKRGLKQVY
jgi:hypothetical protein